MLSIQNSLPVTDTAIKGNPEREGFSLSSSQDIRKRHQNLVLLVTGGFRSREGVNPAIQTGACDLVGLARPAAKLPDLPSGITFDNRLPNNKARFDVESAPCPKDSLRWC